MGTRTAHAPGTFSWVDLSTTDPDAAKEFYSGIFGWEYDDLDAGEGMIYTMCKVDGSQACAISKQQEGQAAAGVPPLWNNYVTVESAGASTEKAKELGGNVMMEAFDVMDAGRMSVIADPTGAVLCLWEPKESIGAQIVNAHGALTWNELHTPDPDAAQAFYADLFGWTYDPMDTQGGPPYSIIMNGGSANGGVTNIQMGEPPSWLPYFAVDSLEEAISTAEGSGGSKLAGPIPMPQGQIAVLADPQNAAFALWEGELAD